MPLLGGGQWGRTAYMTHRATVLSQAPNAFFSVSSLIKERKETIYVELVSFGTPRQEHTWNRFIQKNGTRVIYYFWYFLSYWMISSIPRIPRTQMKSLHFWFLVVTYFHIRLMERIEKCNYTNSHFYLFCQEHTWYRFIRKNGTRVIVYFTYFHRWTHMK